MANEEEMKKPRKTRITKSIEIPKTVNMTTYDQMITTIAPMINSEAISILDSLQSEMDVASFGKMNSHIYRNIFESLCKRVGLADEVKALVIFFASLVKDNTRIVKHIEMNERWTENADVQEAKDFIEQYMTKYTNSSPDKMFPMVKLPDSYASLSTYYFARYAAWSDTAEVDTKTQKPTGNMVRMPNANLLIENLFFCGMDISIELQNLQMEWEENLWAGEIKKSSNKSRNSKHELGKFHKDIYDTRKKDSYPFINSDGSKYTEVTMPDIQALTEYIKDVAYWKMDVYEPKSGPEVT